MVVAEGSVFRALSASSLLSKLGSQRVFDTLAPALEAAAALAAVTGPLAVQGGGGGAPRSGEASAAPSKGSKDLL